MNGTLQENPKGKCLRNWWQRNFTMRRMCLLINRFYVASSRGTGLNSWRGKAFKGPARWKQGKMGGEGREITSKKIKSLSSAAA